VALREARGFRLHADDLARAVTPATRLIFLNSPHNPTGSVLTRDDIRAIGAVAKAHDLWILSDEVYESLVFRRPFASPFDEPTSPSARWWPRRCRSRTRRRAFAPAGARARPGSSRGCCRWPKPCCSVPSPSSPTWRCEALSRDFAITTHMRHSYAARAAHVAQVLAGVPGLRVHPPQAGMFVMLSVDGLGLDGEAFALRLLAEERVAVMPGAAFGDAAAGMVRISLTVPDATLADGAQRIAALARRMAAAPADVQR
jgi:arginine:pyruvate transaminase